MRIRRNRGFGRLLAVVTFICLSFTITRLGADPESDDSDGDGYSDYEENELGTSPLDSLSYPGSTSEPEIEDTDGDGHSNADEVSSGTDPNSSTSYPGSLPESSPTDSDGDGSSDEEEDAGGYDPNNSTSYPGYEASIDSDNDGYSDHDEASQGTSPSDPNSFPGSTSNPQSQDLDGDGYSDDVEISSGSDPYDSSSYPGSYVDPSSIDSDQDGFSDGEESFSGTNPYDSGSNPTYGPDYSTDTDGDSYSDADEVNSGTDPSDSSTFPGSDYYLDSDWDGWSDGDEISNGTDPNNSASYPGSSDPYTTDSDSDGYYDYDESVNGTDPNNPSSYPGYLNSSDSDGDGHSDADETAQGYDPYDSTSYPGVAISSVDSDSDGISDYDENISGTNPFDSASYPGNSSYDSDGDGYSDANESTSGTDPHNAASYPGSTQDSNVDSDGDGLSDWEESNIGTDSYSADTDQDGLSDGAEVLGIEVSVWVGDSVSGYSSFVTYTLNPTKKDTDSDLLPDGWEIQFGTIPTNAVDGLIDEDSDGLSRGKEVAVHQTDPSKRDTDEDGETDGFEVANETDPLDQSSRTSQDSDGDVMSDDWESAKGLNPESAVDASGDGDADDLINLREYLLGTNPNIPDSDNDGYRDGLEWLNGFDPLNSADSIRDSDGDSLPDLWEIKFGLNPNYEFDRESDIDGDLLTADLEFDGGFYPNNADTDGDGDSDFDEYFGLVINHLDSDGDHIIDDEETAIYGTDPQNSDTDGDGISDSGEVFGTVFQISSNAGSHAVGFLTNPLSPDTDGDGMEDLYEILNFFNPTDASDGMDDEDLDTLSNGLECSTHGTDPFNADTDSDGESDNLEISQGTNPLDSNSNLLDSDGDQMRDSWETANRLNPYNPSDATQNPDGDGLVNVEEFQNNTNPFSRDSDRDGYEDRFELIHGFSPVDPNDSVYDTDDDGMPDLWELSFLLDQCFPFDAYEDPDGDQLYNVFEFAIGTSPNSPDSDHDGIGDFPESYTLRIAPAGTTPATYFTDPSDPDSDGDLLDDGFEIEEGLHAMNPSDGRSDFDGDGLSNGSERSEFGTDWEERDTDSDGEPDGFEIENGTNPLDILSRTSPDEDGDHMSDLWEISNELDPENPDGGDDPDEDELNNHGEYLAGTDPHLGDSDGDGYSDGLERFWKKDPLNPFDAEDDSDGDRLPDCWEITYNLPWKNAHNGSNDPDGDGTDNLTEYRNGSNPLNSDSDGDGIGDSPEIAGFGTTTSGISWVFDVNPAEADTDRDGDADLYEIEHGADPTNPSSRVVTGGSGLVNGANVAQPVDGSDVPTSPRWTFGVVDDSDGDGVSDSQEIADGTGVDDSTNFKSPISPLYDSDRNGLLDQWEAIQGFDPMDPTQGWRDQDYDRLNNIREQALNTHPAGTWTSTDLGIMSPNGPVLGADSRFPNSVIPTFNDFNEFARVSLIAGQISVSIFDGSAWGSPAIVNLDFSPTFCGEVVRNNLGLLAVEVRSDFGDGECVVVVVRDDANQVHVIGRDAGWNDLKGLALTDSGFIAAQVFESSAEDEESIIRWRKGNLEVFPGDGPVNFRGINERGEILDQERGLLRNGQWIREFADNHVLGSYGEITSVSRYPFEEMLSPYQRFSHLSYFGEVIFGVARGDETEVVKGFHVRHVGRTGEHIITRDDWMVNVDSPDFEGIEVPSGGSWMAGVGGSYTYVIESPGITTYDFDFDEDNDGFWNSLELVASTDPFSDVEFPGSGENIVVSDANSVGDFVGWIFNANTVEDPVSGLLLPNNDAYFWQNHEFTFLALR